MMFKRDMLAKIKSFLSYCLAKANRKIVRIDSFGQNPIDDVLCIMGKLGEKIEVFDVGANIGAFSESVIRRAPWARINAFEPFPEAFQELSQLEKKNAGVLKAHNFALSDAPGEKEFFINSQSVTNSLLPNASDADKYQPSNYAVPMGSIKVKLDTLDSVCQRSSISRIHLLKVDTQGADINVLKGGEQMMDGLKVCAVLVEVLFVPLYEGQGWFDEIYGWLHGKGFKLVKLYDVAHADETKEAKWADALFVNQAAIQAAA